MTQRFDSRAGFTSNELGPVVVVIVVLGFVAYSAMPDPSPTPEYQERVEITRSMMVPVIQAIIAYHADTGAYPASLDDLTVDPGIEHWRAGGYLPSPPALTDAWGNEFVYDPPSGDAPYRLRCLGADGEEGGEDINADFGPGD
jgi:general secretion pathway protein G